jgi:hypothetical protein
VTQADSDSSFLAAGVRHFPDAHAAVSAFRRLITEKVELILNSSRPDVWKPKDVHLTRGESNGLWVGAGGPMALEGITGRTLVIDVGIWWKSSHFKEPRAAAAVVYSAKDTIGRPLEGRDDAGVRFVRSGTKMDIFGIPLADDTADVEDALRRVVEAASHAVANAIAAAKTSGFTIPQEDQ